jgi:hypothetical protein
VKATKSNVFLIERPQNYDQHRSEHLKRINEQRSERYNPKLVLKNQKRQLKDTGEFRTEVNRQIILRRKLRFDTVDTIGEVVQPDAEFINGLTYDEQLKFFKDSLSVMQDNPDYFGNIETAVIHFDETTPHMQALASTLDDNDLTSKAKIIMGNKTKMSKRQDVLADGLKGKGWDVKRGIKRIDNPDYKNWKTEAESKGYEVNRYNDRKLMADMKKANDIKLSADEYDKNKRIEADGILNNAREQVKSSTGKTKAQLDKQESDARKLIAEAQRAKQELLNAKESKKKIDELLAKSRDEAGKLYQTKKRLNDDYNAQWGDHKNEMAKLRKEHEMIWSNSDMQSKWDTAALKLKDAKQMQYSMRGQTGFLAACFSIFGAIQQMQAQKQLEALKKARDEAMKDVKERKQIERDKWDREKQKHKNELSDINGKIDIAKTNRDDIQAQAKHAKQELEQAKQGLLPFQKNAKSILDDATFWNKQSKRNLSEHDRKRVKDAVNSNDKSINLNLNGLNQNDMQL